jgi:hypothetical protein
MLASRSEQPRRTSLLFKEYGKKRFLSEVNVLGREDRYVLIKSKAESRLAQLEKAKTIHAPTNSATRRF